MRRVAAALFVSKKASDKATLRLIEVGFGLSLDPIRLSIRRSFDEGHVIERPNKCDIVLPSGHAFGIVKNPGGDVVVLTVLAPGMLLKPAEPMVDGTGWIGDMPVDDKGT